MSVRVRRRLARLAMLLTQAGQVVRALAEDPEVQLAVAPDPRLMDLVEPTNESGPVRPISTATNALPRALLGVNGMAELLGVDAATIRRWRRAGELPAAVEIGNTLRWRPETVDAWLREREVAS